MTWVTSVIFIDINTGEVISRERAEKYYEIVKKNNIMSESTTIQQKEELSMNADSKNSNSSNSSQNTELVEMEEIENTPFQIVGNVENGFFVAFGKYRVTEPKETKEESLTEFNNKGWSVLINTISAIIDYTLKLKEND